ncbi:hypothetical protein O9929_01060 [Vibrio lentus]|nr:hypothetical protein [Vibrio lentus]
MVSKLTVPVETRIKGLFAPLVNVADWPTRCKPPRVLTLWLSSWYLAA